MTAIVVLSAIANVISTVVMVFSFYLMWKVFVKAAIPGWQCLIPFWNIYCFSKIAKVGALCLFLMFIFPPTLIYATYKMYKQFNFSTGLAVASLFVPFLGNCAIVFGTYEYNFE